jgi:hypothetical protein
MEKRKTNRTGQDLRQALDAVYLYKVLLKRGKASLFDNKSKAPVFIGGDEPYYQFEVIIEALCNLSDAVWSNYSEKTQVESMYFSSPDIMEYYRLCREYGKQAHVPLRDNPYVLGAAEYVDNQLEQGCYTCSHYLQTKINHKWASGIVFRMWPEFDGQLALLVFMVRIFDYYARELARLKTELKEMKSGPAGSQGKEAA